MRRKRQKYGRIREEAGRRSISLEEWQMKKRREAEAKWKRRKIKDGRPRLMEKNKYEEGEHKQEVEG